MCRETLHNKHNGGELVYRYMIDVELINTMLDATIASLNGSELQPVVHCDRSAHYSQPATT